MSRRGMQDFLSRKEFDEIKNDETRLGVSTLPATYSDYLVEYNDPDEGWPDRDPDPIDPSEEP